MKKLSISRRFTVQGVSPYDDLELSSRHIQLRERDGTLLVDMEFSVPESWGMTAARTICTKYARKAGVPDRTIRIDEDGIPARIRRSRPAGDAEFGAETNALQIFDRLAGAWAYWGIRSGLLDAQGAEILFDELRYMLSHQVGAPNSPQWFNTGLHWAYGIEGPPQGHYYVDDDTGRVRRSDNAYERVQAQACFIQSVADDLVNEGGIMDLWMREARLFKFGSGTGTNFSSVRGKNEPLSGGGVSSGLMSFLEVGDRAAAGIQSGGTCLAPHQRVYTARGPVPVAELCGTEFVALSYDPPSGRYMCKRASAWEAGRKRLVRVKTDKGCFEVSHDHPFRLSTGEYRKAEDLEGGLSLFACSIDCQAGYVRVHLRNGMKGKERLHRLVAMDVMGEDIDGMSVHHLDEDKLNNRPDNLEVLHQSEHARQHNMELVEAGEHVFQNNDYGQGGADNPMHRSSDFWDDPEKVAAYKAKQAEHMTSARARSMQNKAARTRMLNFAYGLINAGYSIETFEKYVAARTEHYGVIASVDKVRCSIDDRFGSYEQFHAELLANNHRVVSVEFLHDSVVYDVEVECPTADDKSPETGHNFVIWPDDEPFGSGVVVANTRRAAKIVVLDADHPEIEDFVVWKAREEDKVASMVVGSAVRRRYLAKIVRVAQGDPDPTTNEELGRAVKEALRAGVLERSIERAIRLAEGRRDLSVLDLDVDWQGEAYRTVSGQQSNNSVRLTDAFMLAVERKGSWHLTRRTDGEIDRTVRAEDLWDQICEAAWLSGDPGLQFHTTINAWHTCPGDGEIRGTNPCGEYHYLDDTACNLASIRLTHFYDGNRFDTDAYRHAIALWTTVLEISVSMSHLPSKSIARGTFDYRTLGLGYADIGALIMRMGLPYDSDAGRELAAALTAILTGEAYRQSAAMAEVLGPFPRYEDNAEHMARVMDNHRLAAHGVEDASRYRGLPRPPMALSWRHFPNLSSVAREVWDDVVRAARQTGFRNAQATVIAPTGTIGLVMGCDTTGIEPDYALVKTKSLAGGGMIRIVNHSVPSALAKCGYTDEQVADIVRYAKGTGSLPERGLLSPAWLAEQGMSDAMMDAASNALSSAPHIELAFAPAVVGIARCESVLGLTTEQCHDPSFSLLRWFGLSEAQIEELHALCCGHGHLEGAPHLRERDLPIFDCASAGSGTRSIRPEGHLLMMGAVQPFVSGAISKTVNAPASMTVSDIGRLYWSSWRLGLKAVAIYRSGSKLSQPLTSSVAKALFSDLPDDDVKSQAERIAGQLVVRYLSERRKLPNRRSGYTQKAKISGHKVFLKTGEYPDGSLGEIFCTMHRQGASFGSLMNMLCIAVSIGLQHGVPLERYVDLFTFSKFEPSGMVDGDDNVRMCTSVVDWIFRHLAVNYLGRDDLAHIEPVDLKTDEIARVEPEIEREERYPISAAMMMSQAIDVDGQHADGGNGSSGVLRRSLSMQELAIRQGFEGEACGNCGAMTLVKNGNCSKCLTCSETTGCS